MHQDEMVDMDRLALGLNRVLLFIGSLNEVIGHRDGGVRDYCAGFCGCERRA